MSNNEAFTLEPEQQRAARTLDRNVSVEAGAGTGKTTTLTERYLTILRAYLDGPETLRKTAKGDEAQYRLPADIEPITDPEEARRLPERIVVTTFTERAAEDLKQAIRTAIRNRLAEIDNRDRWELWRAAADGVEASYIHTIHGFCSRLLQEYATAHDEIDPKFDVLEEEEAELLSNRLATEIVEEESDEVRTLASLFDRGKLVSVLSELLTERRMTERWIEQITAFEDETAYESFLVSIHPFEPDPAALLDEIEDHVQTLCTLFEDDDVSDRIGTNPMKYVGRPLQEWYATFKPSDPDSLTPFDRLSLSIDLCTALTNGDNEAYADSSYYGNKGFRTADDAVAERYATTMESLLETVAPASQSIDASIAPDRDAYEYLTALAALTERTIDRYQEHKTRQESLDYDDLIGLTVELLTEAESDDAAHIREKFRYIMVDEFQDTNERQWDLVQALATETQVFDGDNVFVVGDMKQSIYRFRDADVTVFDTAQAALDTANAAAGTPNDGPPLVTNFRTLPDTLQAINGLFDSVFAYGGAKPFEATAQPLRPGRSNVDAIDAITEYMPVPVDSELRGRFLQRGHGLQALPDSEPADIEATAIASRIAAMLNGDKKVSTADSDRDGRPVTPDDIAVLIRSRGDLKDYERALRDASIPYTVVKGEGFYETPEIRSIVSLFKTLANPMDEIALYATLRSPLCGLTDEQIATAYDPDRPLWECLKTTEHEEIGTVVEDLERWRTYAGATEAATGPRVESWSVLADRIFEETGYMTAVAADERGRAAVSNLDKFREKLREFDASGVPSIDAVVTRFTEQAEQGRAEAEANVAEESATVNIMTIHEAKGQEFPVVVVPGLGREFLDRGRISNGSVEFELVPVEGERTPVLGLSVPGAWGEDYNATLLRHVARNRRRAEEYAEEKRILYVACTRAEDHLILTGQHAADADEPTGIEAPEPDDPSTMRDWVQPTLFGTDNEAVRAWEALSETGEFMRELSYDIEGTTKHGEVKIRLPPDIQDYADEREAIDPATQRSDYEYDLPWEILLSPSAVTGLVDGSQELTIDEETNQIRAESVTGTTANHSTAGDKTKVPAALFGQAVHRLCETRPPKSEWQAFVTQVFEEEHPLGAGSEPPELTDDVFEDIATAAERAVSYLDELHASYDPVAVYDEFQITLSIPHGELQGYIDHLVVTENAYHVVDYKTDRNSEKESVDEFLARRAQHHEPQVMAYAAALQRADPDRSVSATLFFTDVDESYSWRPEDVQDAYGETLAIIDRNLPDEVDTHLTSKG